jgi:anti-sigma-K factor RskA
MIPENPEDLHVLAGEYVLGVLDEPDASEVAEALTTNSAAQSPSGRNSSIRSRN